MSKYRITIAVIIVLCIPSILAAATGEIAVIYKGNSEVNRETFVFFRKFARQLGHNYNFVAHDARKELTNSYDGYIVLNTGRRSGIDPAIVRFLNNSPELENVVLVNLQKGVRHIDFEYAYDEEHAVDAISAASYWNHRSREGQVQWFKQALDIISSGNIE